MTALATEKKLDDNLVLMTVSLRHCTQQWFSRPRSVLLARNAKYSFLFFSACYVLFVKLLIENLES